MPLRYCLQKGPMDEPLHCSNPQTLRMVGRDLGAAPQSHATAPPTRSAPSETLILHPKVHRRSGVLAVDLAALSAIVATANTECAPPSLYLCPCLSLPLLALSLSLAPSLSLPPSLMAISRRLDSTERCHRDTSTCAPLRGSSTGPYSGTSLMKKNSPPP